MKKLIYTLFLGGFFFTINAQEKIDLEDVQVIKSFETVLEETKLILIEQSIPTEIVKDKTFDYNISTLPLEINYPDPIIKPVAIKKEELPIFYDGHLDLGVGYPLSIYGDVGYNYHYNNLYDFNIGAQYLSFNNDKNISDQNFKDFSFQLDGKYHINELNTVTGIIKFDQKDVHYYNQKKLNDSIATDQRQINFTTINVGYGNHLFNERNFTYFIDGGFNIFSLKDEDINETQIPIHTQLNYQINDRIDMDLSTNLNLNFASRDSSFEQHSIHITPAINYTTLKIKLSGGVDMVFNNRDQSLLMPKLDIAYELKKSMLIFNLGIKSNHYDNNMNQLTAYNPYTRLTNFDYRANMLTDYYIGFNGRINKLSYTIQGGYLTQSDKALFALDSLSNHDQFNVFYEEVNTSYIDLTVDYDLMSNLTIGTGHKVYFHELKNYDSPISLPAYEHRLYAHYKTFKNKLIVGADLKIEHGILNGYLVYENVKNYVNDPLINFNLSVDYLINDRWKVFIKGDNLINSSYDRWYGYTKAPINIIGGIGYKF